MYIQALHGALIASLVVAVASQIPPPADASIDTLHGDDATNTTLAADALDDPLIHNGTDVLEMTEAPIEDPPIDMGNVKIAPLSDSLFDEIPDGVTEKRHIDRRQASRGKYTLMYSHDAVEASNYSLYAVHASKDAVDGLLQNAIAVANAQDPAEFHTSFNTSMNNLTLIANAIGSTPTQRTMTWSAFGAVAGILLNNNTPGPTDRTESWVGVGKDGFGTVTAEIAIIPNLIVVEPDPAPASVEDGVTDPTPAIPSPGPKRRRVKRALRAVMGRTDTVIMYGRIEEVHVPGRVLVELMDEAVTVIETAALQIRTYTEYFSRVRLMTGTNRAAPAHEHTFSFATAADVRLTRSYVLLIFREIRRIAREWAQAYGANAFAVRGTVRRDGRVIAQFTLGGPAGTEVAEGAQCPARQQRVAAGPVVPQNAFVGVYLDYRGVGCIRP